MANDYTRAFVEGPFTEQLMQPYVAPRNPAGEAGWGGVGTGIMHFVTNFLEGASRARAMKVAEEGQRQAQYVQVLGKMLEQVDRSDIIPQYKDQVRQKILGAMLPPVAQADNGEGKKSGNPLFQFVKNAAQNLLGPTPKGVKLDESTIGSLWTEMQQAPTSSQVEEKALGALHEAINDPSVLMDYGDSKIVDTNRLIQSPKFNEFLRLNSMIGRRSPAIESAMERLLPPQAAAQYARDAEYRKILERTFNPTSGSQTPTAAPSGQPTEPPQPTAPTPQAQQPTTTVPAAQPAAQNPMQAFAASHANDTPFLTDQVVSPRAMQALNAVGGTPKVMWLIDVHNPNRSIPIYQYPSGYTVTQAGNRIVDMGKVDPRRWRVDTDAPTVRAEATPEQIEQMYSAIKTGIQNSGVRENRLVASYLQQLDTAKSAQNPVQEMREVERRFHDAANRLTEREYLSKVVQSAVGEKPITPYQKANLTIQLSKLYRDSDEYTDYAKARSQFGIIETLYNHRTNPKLLAEMERDGRLPPMGVDWTKSGAVDLAIIKAFQVLTDPRTGVRDFEIKVGQELGGKIQSVLNIVNRATTGQMLPKNAAESIYRAAKVTFDVYKKELVNPATQVAMQAQELGINPASVISNYRDLSDEINKRLNAPQGNVGGAGASGSSGGAAAPANPFRKNQGGGSAAPSKGKIPRV